MGFGGVDKAMEMRRLIEEIARSVIDRERPKYRYAVVQTIDRTNYKCTVIFTGEDVAVPVNMGAIQPKLVGQTVRVEGIRTDKFITDVMGPPFIPGLST